jgi:VCBS repeat-containing protein
VPFGPKAAVLGVNGSAGGTVTLWSDPIATNPKFDATGTPPTETWELWNWTADGHPIHLHEVKFKVLNRETFDPLTGNLVPGSLRAPEATEAGWKDTVVTYPGEVTRVTATFDIEGLYVWHCHIVEHEDNEMMVPYCVGDAATAPGCNMVPFYNAPVAGNDAFVTPEDTPLTAAAPGVLANDTDPDGDALTAALVSGPANGALTLNPDGSFGYTPNGNFNGSDAFTYVAYDGISYSNVATVTIGVSAVNDAPVAGTDAYTTTEDIPLTVAAPGVLVNDTDADGDILTAALVQGPANGTLNLGSTGGFIYTPNAGFTGTDSFLYRAFDGAALSNEAAVTITVNPAPSPLLYLSLTNKTGTLVGLGPKGSDLAYGDEDVLSWNGSNYAIVFDGSAAGLAGSADIFAFDLDTANTRILMAFSAGQTVPGVGAVTPSDIVAYNLPSGPFSLAFDGSDVGLDSVPVPQSTWMRWMSCTVGWSLSTRGAANVPGVAALDEDLLAFAPAGLRAVTTGTWALYASGSDVGLSPDAAEDVDGAAVAGNGDIYLSTFGNFSVAGVTGQDEDVFICTPSSLGPITACTFAPFFDGTAYGLGAENVDAIDLP